MADGEHEPAVGQLPHAFHYTLDFRSRSDDADTRGHFIRRAHDPVLLVCEVCSAIDVLEGGKAIFGCAKEWAGMSTFLGELEERAFSVPAKEVGPIFGRYWTKKV